ncbi:uncharacterized protein LOC108022008 [Drosophila biarmipes]|uniref:uncharacterized protein LOC108022008 n=1 Tax=Drosophila biarmipes TaxID=125945 RepID=UPI0007E6B3E8|nr:uncharacterized protein LOC108022008 [Drosophila biarmipes]XP_050744648.1 uncharacterized protein LOC108022008 [Drosophila biarmipes]
MILNPPMDGDQSCSDRNSEYSLGRRNGVHYATIAEFLASLNVNDTTLGSVQGLKTLSLEDYLKIMRGADQEQGDGDITLEARKMESKLIQETHRQRQSDPKNPNKSNLISQYTEQIWI